MSILLQLEEQPDDKRAAEQVVVELMRILHGEDWRKDAIVKLTSPQSRYHRLSNGTTSFADRLSWWKEELIDHTRRLLKQMGNDALDRSEWTEAFTYITYLFTFEQKLFTLWEYEDIIEDVDDKEEFLLQYANIISETLHLVLSQRDSGDVQRRRSMLEMQQSRLSDILENIRAYPDGHSSAGYSQLEDTVAEILWLVCIHELDLPEKQASRKMFEFLRGETFS